MFSKSTFNQNTPLLVFAFHFMPVRGGIQKYAFEMVRQLHKNGRKVIVLARACPGHAAFDADQPFRIIRMKGTGIRFLRLFPMAVYFFLTIVRYRIRLVHCMNWIPCGYVARVFRYVLFYRYLISCHGAEVTMSLKWPRRLFLKTTLQHASWLIAGNNFMRDRLNLLNIPKTPVSVIGLGADPEFFRPGLDAEFLRAKYGCQDKTVLLTVAELKSRKGIDKTLLAVKALGEKGKDLLYLVVGEGPDRPRLERIARENSLENQVIFTGAVQDKDLRFYYALCDIFVLPNREEKNGDVEGFCIVVIEAGACEKPVIGGRSGGVTDSVADGKTGLLVDPYNEKDIAEKIAWLADNPDKAQEMGKNGRQRILSIYTWPLMTSKTEMVYSEIFSRKKRR